MSEEFDYGGEVAESTGKFKKATVGTRNARLYGLMRLGTYCEVHEGVEKEPAPQVVSIFHLLGKEDVSEDGEPMFFNKTFPLKKGEKSFLHRAGNGFISAFGGLTKNKGFGDMINKLFSLNLKGSKKLDDDGKPKYTNFGSMSEIAEETLELLEASGKYAALENPVGFLTESQLTEEALMMLHPTMEFAGILMKTKEFKEGTHPKQGLIQSMYDKDPERYTIKETEDSTPNGANTEPKGTAKPEELDGDEEY